MKEKIRVPPPHRREALDAVDQGKPTKWARTPHLNCHASQTMPEMGLNWCIRWHVLFNL